MWNSSYVFVALVIFRPEVILFFLTVSEPERAVPEQVKESGRMHTGCELLQPQETALIGGLLLLLVLPFVFFLLLMFISMICPFSKRSYYFILAFIDDVEF